jgi:hypothetical protein
VIHLGFDEAGYGPLLGPLVVGMAAFRVADDGAGGHAVDLRTRLAGLVTQAVGRRVKGDPAVAIDDSKRVHGRDGVEGLARGVRAVALAAGLAAPEDLADLLARFGDRPPEAFAGDPWCAGPEAARLAPWEQPPGWREAWLQRGGEPGGLRVAPGTPAELQRRSTRSATRARPVPRDGGAPRGGARRVADRRRRGGARPRGGGSTTRPTSRPCSRSTNSRASPRPGRVAGDSARAGGACGCGSSRGRPGLARDGPRVDGGETDPRALHGALARGSRARARRAPTAGYVEDGRRFLGDVAGVIERERIDRRRLVRSR